MNIYLNDKQENILNVINEFLKDNKKIILKDTNATDTANIETVANKIENYLQDNNIDVTISRYFNGKNLSNSKLEVLDKENNNKELYIYISTRRKVLNKRIEKEDQKEINGNKIQFVKEFITYEYSLSASYETMKLY